MTARRAAILAVVIAVAIVPAASCGGAPPPISLDGGWPDRPRDFETATEAWTRHGTLRADIAGTKDRILDVYATFKAPEWRAAYIDMVSRTRKLTPGARQQLADEQRTADRDHYEVELLVSTYDARADDLQKNLRSTWRVALVDGSGTEIRPSQIKRDRRPRSEILEEFPGLSDFHTPYVAMFPRTVELLGAGAQRFTLTIGSSRGGIELVWP